METDKILFQRQKKICQKEKERSGVKHEELQDKKLALKILENMYRCRKFEEKIQHYFSLGMIHGTTHLSIGEEATAAGTCAALTEKDQIFATHRGHSQVLCKGMDVNKMMAEIFGKATGSCKGKGGSMHFSDKDKGVMSSNGIVGPSLPMACGVAFAHKARKEKAVTAVFFGDGATNEGAFHEAMNLASVWRLPVLFICVNNTYGISTHISKVMRDTDISKRAIPFGMQSKTVDGNDVEAVYYAVKQAREAVLQEEGPVLIVENTYRISGHSKSDKNVYRTQEEIDFWKEKCPILRWRQTLFDRNICTQEELDAAEAKTTKELEKAVQFALDSPFPSVEEVYQDIYAD